MPVEEALFAAPRSGERRVTYARELVAAYERRLAVEREKLRRLEAGESGECRVVAAMTAMVDAGWQTLDDRLWPGTRGANVDLLCVGPGGVLVVDVKTWAEPRIENGMLWRGDLDASDEVDKLLRLTRLAEEATADLGDGLALVPREVVPVIVLAGRTDPPVELGRVVVVGESKVVGWAHRRARRLRADQVERVTGVLAEAFPPHPAPVRTPRVLPLAPVVPAPAEAEQPMLPDLADIEQSLLEHALDACIEEWMTFLHPDQVRLVQRSFNGPARVRGAAGTGKTVVALHRAAYLAETTSGRVLVTTFVRTLPAVLSSLYARLAPGTADRVEFTGLHSWARRHLDERGLLPGRYDPGRAETLFNRAWLAVGRRSCLTDLDVAPGYWREEVDVVVRGRGLVEFEDYAGLRRVGRRTRLTQEHRRAVWDLHVAYAALLEESGVVDANDLLALALRSVESEPLDPGYAAVVADEVQDLSCTGVRLLHALVGDVRDGLLLVGDGQQSVYPGGFALAEAGVSVTGRASVLRVNYRNAREVLEAAQTLVEDEDFEDLDGVAELGRRETTVARDGGEALRVDAADEASLQVALVRRLRETVQERGIRPGDCAVLAANRVESYRWAGALRAAGFATQDLADYVGTTSDCVKVGTVKRAKGLEFAYVFLPGLRDGPPPRRHGEDELAWQERTARRLREQFVAMTRARDGVWLGYLPPR